MANPDDIRRIHSALHRLRRLQAHTNRVLPLRPLEFNILEAIIHLQKAAQDKLPPSLVSSHLQVQPPTISPILNQLENNGYITRSHCPNDRRMVHLHLTPKGEEAFAQMDEHRTQLLGGILDRLGEEETAHALRILETVADYMKEYTQIGGNPRD